MGIARNAGKAALVGPIKPKEPTEKSFLCNTGKPQAALKKSFLSNAGKPLQSTPVHQKIRQVFAAPTPIYSDVDTQEDCFEELEFTRPPYKLGKLLQYCLLSGVLQFLCNTRMPQEAPKKSLLFHAGKPLQSTPGQGNQLTIFQKKFPQSL